MECDCAAVIANRNSNGDRRASYNLSVIYGFFKINISTLIEKRERLMTTTVTWFISFSFI